MISQNSESRTQNGERSKDIKHRTYFFSLQIIKFINQFPSPRVYWSIADQLIRCSTSVGANVVEAQGASSKRDFLKFYEIALKSAYETDYWLCITRDSFAGFKKEINPLLTEIQEIIKMLRSSVLTLKERLHLSDAIK